MVFLGVDDSLSSDLLLHILPLFLQDNKHQVSHTPDKGTTSKNFQRS